jgi:uncharacterized protein YjbI with pentapeptide repeats
MANNEHLNILKQGINAWNQWRKENPGVQPDLSAAILSEPDLRGADLRGVNLTGIYGGWANFSGVNLSRAELSEADLICTNFRDAILSGADLRGADLHDANLSGAEFAGARLLNTVFTAVDLSQVEGLEAVQHQGPSEISISTIYLSQGNIPEIFLRGAGVPDPFIANMKSLVAAMSPIQFYSCFISYSSQDQEFADRLYSDLQAKGVRCWLASEDLKIGDPFRQRIDDAIRRYDKLLVVLSETSAASSWVESEVEAALEKERTKEGKAVLFPIRLDEAVMKTKQAWAADIRRKRHVGDFTQWQDYNL